MILGSDGLFDNLYDDEILEEVQNCIDQQTTTHNNNNNTDGEKEDPSSILHQIAPQTISDALAWRAKIVSEDPDNPSSPFQVRAMHEGLYYQVPTRLKHMWLGVFRPVLLIGFVCCRAEKQMILVLL